MARDGRGREPLPRLVRLTTGYRDATHLRGGSPQARALAATIRSLAAAPELPELGDVSVLADPARGASKCSLTGCERPSAGVRRPGLGSATMSSAGGPVREAKLRAMALADLDVFDESEDARVPVDGPPDIGHG